MNKTVREWQAYWSKKSDAEHRHNTKYWKDLYSKELMIFFPDRVQNSLELGCGNGDLIKPLLYKFSNYIGTDFSITMLRKFKNKNLNGNLICSDASNLPFKDGLFDYVFSNGVCQYMDKTLLKNNLLLVNKLLIKGGKYFIGNIPDKQLRNFYYANALRGDIDFSLKNMLKSEMYRCYRKYINKKIDYNWFTRRFISLLANECGFSCKTFSSISYEYRFHSLLEKEH